MRTLTAAGWDACIVWECETKNQTLLAKQVSQFLNMPMRSGALGIRVRGGQGH